ncbi:glycosyltransferase [Marinobacter adhaerens]|uniref:Glycosyltransferase n=1 Tax=Marinobacter adhaerens TaxID=1033846 RepID=A0A851HVF8_9GAMM|nr:glycosyltransferase [Marinobacter adhaerens]NWN92710.1 glycosyltransferase [Marinobacter adhaerens]
MKIAFIIGASNYQQSLYKVTYDVSQEIQKNNHSVDFVFWENPGNLISNDKHLKIFGLSKDSRGSKLFFKLFSFIFGKHFYYYIFSYFFVYQLNKSIETENYDAIFFQGQSCIPMHTFRNAHYIVAHSCKYENLVARYSGIKRHFYRWLYKRIYSSKRILTVSEDVKKDMIQKIGAIPESINVIYNGFDFYRLYTKTLEEPPEGLPSSFIMAAGRPDRTKRFDILLKAYAKTRKQYPLVIFGDGKLLINLKKLSNNLGISRHVVFAGFCADILPAFRNAKLYISSSDVEGLPTVIVESLIAGTPVVATDAGGSYELLNNDLNKWVVPRGDVDALASAIDDILEEPPAVSPDNIAFLDHRLIAERYITLSEQLKG